MVAIRIDSTALRALDRLVGAWPELPSRSACVRLAIREYVARQHRRQLEEHDRQVLHGHRRQLLRQAAALIADSATIASARTRTIPTSRPGS